MMNGKQNNKQAKDEKLERTLANLAVEAWKMGRAVRRAQTALEPKQAKRLGSRLKWFEQKTQQALKSEGIQIVNPVGETYDEGMAVRASNGEDYKGRVDLVIDDTIEPILIGKGGRVLHVGVVLVKEREQ